MFHDEQKTLTTYFKTDNNIYITKHNEFSHKNKRNNIAKHIITWEKSSSITIRT